MYIEIIVNWIIEYLTYFYLITEMSSDEPTKPIKMQDIESSIRAFDNIAKNRFRQQKSNFKYKIDEFNVYTTLG